MPRLGVNIDHVATLRQARYRGVEPDGSATWSPGEPDPASAAFEAERGGADCITVHLREDRRHISDRDLDLLRRVVRVKLNLEMAATEAMAAIAIGSGRGDGVHMCTLVPEGRQEVTTEGGLDVAGGGDRLARLVAGLKMAGLVVSAFIDPEEHQVRASVALGFDACELHTGAYAEAFARGGGNFGSTELAREWGRLERAGAAARAQGLSLHAGHALNYHNVADVARLEGLKELHIGHAIVSRAVFVGLARAVQEMRALIA